MTTAHFIQQIRQLIAANLLPAALENMRLFAAKTPLLNEVLQQSGRLAQIRQQYNLGLVSHNEATIEQNRIRYGLLELLDELEQNGTPPESFDALLAAVEQESTRLDVQAEVAGAISMVNSKNVVVGSTITAGGNVHIGDMTTQVTQNAGKIYNINHIDNANFD
jgi:Effector-associated domain 11